LTPANSAQTHAQFRSIVDLIQSIPKGPEGPQGERGPAGTPGEVSQAAQDGAIARTSANTNGVATPDTPFADPDV
jgi:hypothetical protein